MQLPVSPQPKDVEAMSSSAAEDSSEDEAVEKQPWDSDDELDCSPGMQWWEATCTLVVVVIGVGVMALPQLPMQGGWWMSIASAAACCLAISESGIAMWKGFMAGNHALGKASGAPAAIVSWEDFARTAYGNRGETLVMIVMTTYYLGIAAVYGVLIAEELEHLGGGWLTAKQWLLAFSPAMVLLSLLPNVTAIAKFTPIAVLAIIVLTNVIVAKSVLDGQRWQSWPDLDPARLHRDWPKSPMDLGSVVATLFGAFGVNASAPSVLCEMNNPMEFPKAFRAAMSVVFIIYLAVMCCGYYGYGEFMQSDILMSMTSFPSSETEAFDVPFADWTGPKALVLRNICASLLLGKLVIGLPTALMVIFYSFQTYRGTRDCVPVGSAANKIMRILVVIAAVGIGELVPDFGKLFAVVNSVCGPLLQCFFPILMSYKVRKMYGARKSSCLRRILHALIVLLGAYSLTIGLYDSWNM